MKKFTKIMLIIAVSLLGAGLIFCGVSTAMGASVWRMAKNGELRYGNWHIGPVGLYYSSADGDDEEEDDMDDFAERKSVSFIPYIQFVLDVVPLLVLVVLE
jgi:hypothetical protein